MAQTIGDLNVEFGARFTKLDTALAEINSKLNQTQKKAKSTGSAFSGIGGIIAGAFSVGAIVAFTAKLIAVRGEFERYRAVLENALGSSAQSQAAFAEIQEFASKTPFAVSELTGAFVKLVNQGFRPTTEQLTKMGDLASSTGKSFDQLTEAIIDAQTGEFERLKEFGIRASKSGDQVAFTFKGVETQVKFTAAEIQNYIVGLGDLQGVSGSMAAISETLEGKISNLGDAFDSLLDTLGDTSIFKDAISEITRYISGIEQIIKVRGMLSLNEAAVEESLGANLYNRLSKGLPELEKKYGSLSKVLSVTGMQIRRFQEMAKSGDTDVLRKRGEETSKAYLKLYGEIEQIIKLRQDLSNAGISFPEEAKIPELTKLWQQYQAAAQAAAKAAKNMRGPNEELVPIKGTTKKFKGSTGIATPAVDGLPLKALPSVIDGVNLSMMAFDSTQAAANLSYQEDTSKSMQAANKLKQAVVDQDIAFQNTAEAVGVFGQGLTQAFEDAMNGTQSFVESMITFLARLVQRLLAAAAAAAVLAAILSAIGIGGFGFTTVFSQLSGFNFGGARAGGGPVMAGKTYLVGEQGPELFVPGNGGTIVPNHAMASTAGAGGGGTHVFIPSVRVQGQDFLIVFKKASGNEAQIYGNG